MENYYQLMNMGGGSKSKTSQKGWNCTLDFEEEDHQFLKIRMYEPNGEFNLFPTRGRMPFREKKESPKKSPGKSPKEESKGRRGYQELRAEGYI